MSTPRDPHGGYWPDPNDPASHRAHAERQANNRHGFLKTKAKPTEVPTVLRLEFGEWETPQGMEADDDLKILHGIHHMARKSYDEVLETIDQVAGDDDPSLNHDGRLKIAARIMKDKAIEKFVQKRYAGWNKGIGKLIEEGKVGFAELEAYTVKNGEPKIVSGRQEYLENILNDYIR